MATHDHARVGRTGNSQYYNQTSNQNGDPVFYMGKINKIRENKNRASTCKQSYSTKTTLWPWMFTANHKIIFMDQHRTLPETPQRDLYLSRSSRMNIPPPPKNNNNNKKKIQTPYARLLFFFTPNCSRSTHHLLLRDVSLTNHHRGELVTCPMKLHPSENRPPLL